MKLRPRVLFCLQVQGILRLLPLTVDLIVQEDQVDKITKQDHVKGR